MIREANFLDVKNVVDIGRELYSAAISHNSVYVWDEQKAIYACKQFIDSEDSIVFVDVQGGSIAGFFIGQLTTPIAGNEIIAVDVMMYIRPEYQGKMTAVKLIKRYELWAKSKGAKYLQLGVSSGLKHQRTLAMYSCLGYKPQAITYFKEV